MGRGRKGPIEQSFKKNKKRLEKGYHFSSYFKGSDDIPADNTIDLPYDIIEKLKQMDPKAVADILLK